MPMATPTRTGVLCRARAKSSRGRRPTEKSKEDGAGLPIPSLYVERVPTFRPLRSATKGPGGRKGKGVPLKSPVAAAGMAAMSTTALCITASRIPRRLFETAASVGIQGATRGEPLPVAAGESGGPLDVRKEKGVAG